MINKEQIKSEINTLITVVNGDNIDRDRAVEEFSERLSTIIVNAIKSATITLAPGDITVVGSQTAQQNVTPLILNSKLS